jgi:putative hydrolase of the HAD superfamily
MIKALIFDLDNTLMPESTFWDASFVAACGDTCAEHDLPVETLQAAVFGAADEIWRTSPHAGLHDELGLGTPSWLFGDFSEVPPALGHLGDAMRDVQYQAWTVGLRAAGIRDRSLAVRLADRFRAERALHHELYEDVLPALHAVAGRCALAILTNGIGEVQRAKLRSTALESFFATIVISGELGFGKPDRRAFEQTLAMLGVAAGEAVMVGDSLARDIVPARANGIAAVWLNRTGERTPGHPQTTITSLEMLPMAVDALGG